MANLNGFDATTVEPVNDFEPIPAGKYDAVITAMNAGLAKAIENEKFKAYCESALVNPSVMTPEETEAYYTEQFDVYKGYLADFIQ